MTSRGPFDILVTGDVAGDEREWIKSWWRSEVDESMKEYIGCTCAVVGREILIFGGPNELHLAQRMYNIDLSARQGFRNEESDTLFSIDGLDPRFRRFGERLAEQSDRGAAAVAGCVFEQVGQHPTQSLGVDRDSSQVGGHRKL